MMNGTTNNFNISGTGVNHATANAGGGNRRIMIL